MVNSNHESLQENMQRSLNRPLAEFLKHFLNFEKAPPSRAYPKDNFPAIATATSPHPPSTKSAVVDTRRRRILRSLMLQNASWTVYWKEGEGEATFNEGR